MVGPDEMARIASRHDTAMARAMLLALARSGLRLRPRRPRAPEGAYAGMLWCFRNHGSPLDRPA